MAETYRDRDLILHDMGYRSYAEYLASDLWAGIRTRAYALHGSQCKLCDGRAASIHHISYARSVLLGSNLVPLAPLCDRCHRRVEFTRTGVKRNLAEAQTQYNLMLMKKGRVRKKGVRCPGCDRKTSKRKPYCRACRSKRKG